MREAWIVDVGQMAYRPAWDLQRRVSEAVLAERIPDTVLLVEHLPVYTLGRAAHGQFTNLVWNPEHLAQEGIELVEVDRGGDITYHGPGQLVGYPILHLTWYHNDLHRYLRMLEEAIIKALAEFHIESRQMPPHTGVWVGQEKIAAIGVKASQSITQHGFALNVNPNMTHFAGIIPCGIRDKGVTSMAAQLGQEPTIDQVKPAVETALGEVLALSWTQRSYQQLEAALDISRVG